MKLKSVKIQNFRSIENSGTFKIDDITCLVGKNEAGKTAILQALEILNSAEGNNEYDKLRDYPRRYLNEYDTRHDGNDAIVATTDWELEDEDRAAVAVEFGTECLPKDIITIEKRYGQNDKTWITHFNEESAIKHLVVEANFDATEKSVVDKCTTAQDVIEQLEGREKNTEKHNLLLTNIKAYRDTHGF